MLPLARKDVLPTTQKSSVIYEYKCHCDSEYVGRTSQRPHDRIKQHVPQWLRQQLIRPRRSQPHRSCKRKDTKPGCDSAIGQHFLENEQRILNYDDKRFSILATACSCFHLNFLKQGCQTGVARDVIFCGTERIPGHQIWSSKNCSPKEKKPFKLKLRENSHEVMFDNCFKSRVLLKVTTREVMTLFLEISTISGYITRFPEIVARRSGDFQTMPRNLINWLPVPADKKVWGPLIYSLAGLNFFSTESGPYKTQVCKCGPLH